MDLIAEDLLLLPAQRQDVRIHSSRLGFGASRQIAGMMRLRRAALLSTAGAVGLASVLAACTDRGPETGGPLAGGGEGSAVALTKTAEGTVYSFGAVLLCTEGGLLTLESVDSKSAARAPGWQL